MFLRDFIYAVPKSISKNEVSQTLEFKSNEYRGVWFSYIDWINLIEASCKNDDLDENKFIKLIEQIFKNLKSVGINVLYVHLLAFGDTFYKSKLAAKSKNLKNLNFDKLDPLKIFIKFAKENDIQIHGWINPMRAFLNRDIDSLPNDYNSKKWFEEPLRKKYYLGLAENKWWVLNPCNGEVIKLILDVVEEILTNYDLDEIHIEDYFYPLEISKENYDSSFYDEIKPQNCSIEKFRFLGVSNLVKLIKKKSVEFE